jgi:hypothetical protein
VPVLLEVGGIYFIYLFIYSFLWKIMSVIKDCLLSCFTGLRKVYPYYYSFGSFIKGRWIGKTVMEVYKSEFYTSGVDPVSCISVYISIEIRHISIYAVIFFMSLKGGI